MIKNNDDGNLTESDNKKNIIPIGWLSFFGGISQDIFSPILPLYLANFLGFNKELIGLIEGTANVANGLFRMAGGFLSDKLKKNKPIISAGYFLAMLARPLLAVFSSVGSVFALRFLDETGRGLKGSPKDALIAGSVKSNIRGKSFGMVRMLDTFGSVIGPLILFGLLKIFQNNPLKYHYILFIAAAPLVFTLWILKSKVKEIAAPAPQAKPEIKLEKKIGLPPSFYIFLGIVVLFSLGNSSSAFLILRAQNAGVALLAIPLVYAVFNFIYASASVPIGSLSDKFGREKIIIFGWLIFSLAYLGFASARTPLAIWLFFSLYGIYYAVQETVGKAFVSDLVSAEHRGGAFGIYNSAVGLMALPASALAGFLWDKYNPATAFIFDAAIALIAAILLVLFILGKNLKQPKTNLL